MPDDVTTKTPTEGEADADTAIAAAADAMIEALDAENQITALAQKIRAEAPLRVTPFGYALTAEGKWEVDDMQAIVVRTIFRLRGEGFSVGVIAKALAETGCKTSRGGRWHAATVLHIINRRTVYEGTEAFPAILAKP